MAATNVNPYKPRGRGRVHMVGNAHIDAVWLWRWTEGYEEVRATFRSALDRMDEYPDFIFTTDSVAYFAWVEEHDPELFTRIGERIRQGRWVVTGGWWVEPDCNLPSGESFARHALYSQRYLADRFGITAKVGMNVDPFGHSANLPALLTRSGLDSYTFMRPQAHELDLPAPAFWWESADGSRVLAARIPNEYCAPPLDLDGQINKSLAQLPQSDVPLMVFYGVGNHGGGPTKANLDSIARLNSRDLLPELTLSSPDRYFAEIRDRSDIPVFRGELLPHAIGCYSAVSALKAANRRCENLLTAAESWAAIAAESAGMPDGREELAHAWKQVLFNQFHDLLPGTSIHSACNDALDQYGEAAAIATRVLNRSVQAISREIDIPLDTEMTPLVVFNSHPWPVRDTVEFEFNTWRGPVQVVDAEDRPVASQVIRSEATCGGRIRLALDAKLPALGYRTYKLRSAIAPGTGSTANEEPTRSDLVLHSDRIYVEIDPATGWFSQLSIDGVNLAAPGDHAVVYDDQSDTWSHGIRSYRDVAGVFRPVSVRRTEDGPVRQEIRVISEYGRSRLIERIRLEATGVIDVAVTIDWREQLKLLKLRFPTAISDPVATHQIPYGDIVRPVDGIEYPIQQFVDLTGQVDQRSCGLAVCNDGKYGCDVTGSEIGLTVLRSPVYAWHDPEPIDPDEEYDIVDQGISHFAYRLVPHLGDHREGEVTRRAAELNCRPLPLLECFHAGPRPAEAGFAGSECPNIDISVLKRAEDGDGLVVRAWETAGRATEASLTALGISWTGHFGAHDIKTFRLHGDGTITETGFCEW